MEVDVPYGGHEKKKKTTLTRTSGREPRDSAANLARRSHVWIFRVSPPFQPSNPVWVWPGDDAGATNGLLTLLERYQENYRVSIQPAQLRDNTNRDTTSWDIFPILSLTHLSVDFLLLHIMLVNSVYSPTYLLLPSHPWPRLSPPPNPPPHRKPGSGSGCRPDLAQHDSHAHSECQMDGTNNSY